MSTTAGGPDAVVKPVAELTSAASADRLRADPGEDLDLVERRRGERDGGLERRDRVDHRASAPIVGADEVNPIQLAKLSAETWNEPDAGRGLRGERRGIGRGAERNANRRGQRHPSRGIGGHEAARSRPVQLLTTSSDAAHAVRVELGVEAPRRGTREGEVTAIHHAGRRHHVVGDAEPVVLGAGSGASGGDLRRGESAAGRDDRADDLTETGIRSARATLRGARERGGTAEPRRGAPGPRRTGLVAVTTVIASRPFIGVVVHEERESSCPGSHAGRARRRAALRPRRWPGRARRRSPGRSRPRWRKKPGRPGDRPRSRRTGLV